MRKLSNFLSFVVLLPLFMHSQLKDPEASLTEYFELPRESIYVHLNKSTYVQGDEIWFSGYVYDRKGEVPFTKTTNIQVGIYDDGGTLMHQGLYLGRDGYFKGNIFVDSTYVSGDYYFKATTKWMKNFREDDSYVQKIKVVDPSAASEPEKVEKSSFDVQFLPEGGNLIADIGNNVAIKALNHRGYGVKLREIEIYDSNNRLVTVFDTSPLGMGKFELNPKEGIDYRAKVRSPNGIEQWYDLPKASPRGINVRLSLNPYRNKVGVTFGMNAKTFDEVGGDGYYFLLHKDGESKRIPVQFNATDFKAAFFLEGEDLKTGVNTITLFNSANTPILERLFFVTNGLGKSEPGIQLVSAQGDSLRLAVTSNVEDLRLSISMLPKGTLAYSHQDNIVSNFYLRPYVRGFIENPRYYFTEMDGSKAYELDLLLLTQGWSRYRWEDVRLGPPQPIHPFEDGISLKGAVNGVKPKFKGNLMLSATKYHGQQLLPISHQENQFLVTSFFPENGERLYFSLLDEKGRTKKPGMSRELLNTMAQDGFTSFWEENSKILPYTGNNNEEITQDLIGDKTIRLKEVTVSDELIDNRPSSENNVYVPMYLKNKVTEVDQRMVQDFPYFIDYLRTQYDVIENLDYSYSRIKIISRRNRRSGNGAGVNLIVDDVQQPLDDIGQPNFEILRNLTMGQVESFYIDRLSRYMGARGGLRETIYVYLARGRELSRNDGYSSKKTLEMVVENGFERPDEFYTPKYTTYQSETFEQLGVVHWEPELLIGKNDMQTFTILNTGLKEVTLFVEGMGKDGSLVSFTKPFKLELEP